jgi:sugar phosphate isomerase/epimerase
MKVGVCIIFDAVEGFEEKLVTLKKEGFDNCQMISWKPEVWTDENAKLVNDLMAQYGITISAFWCGWEGPAVWNFYEGQKTLGLVPEEYREMRVKNLCDGSDFAKKLGVVNVVTHMGFIPENPITDEYQGVVAAIKEIAEYCKANNQYLLFETGQETAITLKRTIETVGTGNLGINLDPANLLLYGKSNPCDAVDIFGDYVRGVHATTCCIDVIHSGRNTVICVLNCYLFGIVINRYIQSRKIG